MRKLTLIGAAFCLAACAANEPIVDTRGVNMAQYDQDLADCQAYAEQVSVGRKAGIGAAAGAVVGAAVGAAVGNSRTVERAAGAGAVVGGSKGVARGTRRAGAQPGCAELPTPSRLRSSKLAAL